MSSAKTPVCVGCNSRQGETLLIKRYADDSEFWCFPCVLWHMNNSMLEPPSWICYLFKKFIRIEQRRIPWRYKLRNFASAQATIFEICKYHSANYNLARWHVLRYKLMYEGDSSINFIWRDGVSAIKLKGENMVVSHSSIWESL